MIALEALKRSFLTGAVRVFDVTGRIAQTYPPETNMRGGIAEDWRQVGRDIGKAIQRVAAETGGEEQEK